jgi:hypothetical protein
MFLIFGMEVGDPVVLPVDRDDNAKKTTNFRHDGIPGGGYS